MAEVLLCIMMGVAVISAFIFSYVGVYHTRHLASLMKVAFHNGRISDTEFAASPFSPERAWRIAFVVISIIGIWLMFYGAMVQTFSWMPYDWRGGEGGEEWAGSYLAWILSFVCTALFIIWGRKIFGQIQRVAILDKYVGVIDGFQEGLTRILTRPTIATDFWVEYAERTLRYQQSEEKIGRKEANQLIGILRVAGQLKGHVDEKGDAQNLNNDNVRFGLEDTYIKDPVQVSRKAMNLIRFIEEERRGLVPVDKADELKKLLPESPDGGQAPGFGNHHGTCRDPQRKVIESIIWADQAGTIDEMDHYLRNTVQYSIL